MGLFDKLLKITKVAYNEATKPESFVKGEEFEEYVRKYIFPSDRYELIHRTHSYNDNKGDYIESTLYPDFLFRCKDTGKKFYVEAKFRSGDYDEFDNEYSDIKWTYPKQLKRYQEINKQTPVFLCLGVGGKAKDPERIHIIPMKRLKYIELYDSFLMDHEFYRKKPVFSGYLWKI